MLLSLTHILMASITLLAIMNPFGNISLFVSMTEHMDSQTRKKLFSLIVYTGFSIVVLFGLVGDFMLKYLFRVEMTQIKVAGGILLIILAIKNLFAKKEKKVERKQGLTDEEEMQQAIIPMAFPILVGPGSMTTILIIKKENGIISALLAAILAFIIVKIILSHSHIIEKIFGKLALFIASRVMQIFIMATGVKLLSVGIFEIIVTFQKTLLER